MIFKGVQKVIFMCSFAVVFGEEWGLGEVI